MQPHIVHVWGPGGLRSGISLKRASLHSRVCRGGWGRAGPIHGAGAADQREGPQLSELPPCRGPVPSDPQLQTRAVQLGVLCPFQAHVHSEGEQGLPDCVQHLQQVYPEGPRHGSHSSHRAGPRPPVTARHPVCTAPPGGEANRPRLPGARPPGHPRGRILQTTP